MNDPVSTTTDAAADDADPDPRIDGRRSRWDAHRTARRDELIDAAVEAIGRFGADVGMDQIAAVASTSKPVMYRYFVDKTDLYRAVSERVIGQVLDTLRAVTAAQPPAEVLIHAGVDAYLALLEREPELFRFVARHPLVGPDERPADFASVVAELLGEQLAHHLHRGALDPSYSSPWAEAIVGFINAASFWWLDHPDAMTRRELGNYLSALLWGGAAGVHQLVGQPVDARPAPGIFPPSRPRDTREEPR